MIRADDAPVGTLARGLHLLTCLARMGHEVGVTELAQQAGLDKATTYRLATTLTRLGYLEQDRATRRFRLGLHILDLGFSYLASLDIRQRALPEMRRLHDALDGTISLSILDGTDVVYVERLAPKRFQASVPVGIGARLPAYVTAMGKALLAFLPEPDRESALDRLELKAWTPYTITNRARLENELDKTRTRGYALSEQETVVGLRTVAAPILNGRGLALAALSVAVSTHEVSMAALEAEIAPLVRAAVATVSSHLGHRGPAD